jgi:hypothetical protein
MFTKLRTLLARHDTLLVTLALSALSVAYTAYYYLAGLTLAYGDAESHINIAKRVVSGLTPGFGQIGGNWLPLHHLLMVPFVVNDWLWRTGLGGAIVSMGAFVLSGLLAYKLVKLLTGRFTAALAAVAVFALNGNIAYMQSTPMSELPLIATLIGSVYFFVKWTKFSQLHHLIISSFFAFCGSLIRYDAWFLIIVQASLALAIGISRRWGWIKTEGILIISGLFSSLGIGLWMLWNYLIFKQPLYFLSSPYSAKSQQMSFAARGQLPSVHNWPSSVEFFTGASVLNIGLAICLLALGGLLVSFFRTRATPRHQSSAAATTALLSPFFFNVLSLYLGISILFVPGLLPANFDYQLFNIRYGLMLMPAVAVYVGLLCGFITKKLSAVALVLITALSIIMLINIKPITLEDGQTGLSARRPSAANGYVSAHYDYGYVAFDDFSRSANPVSLGVPMQKIIYVGNHPYWENMLEHPQKYARWLIIRHDDTDVLWQHLEHNPDFLANYHQVYSNQKTYVYVMNGESPRQLSKEQ